MMLYARPIYLGVVNATTSGRGPLLFYPTLDDLRNLGIVHDLIGSLHKLLVVLSHNHHIAWLYLSLVF